MDDPMKCPKCGNIIPSNWFYTDTPDYREYTCRDIGCGGVLLVKRLDRRKPTMDRIRKYLDLSIAHITYGDNQLLTRFSKGDRAKILHKQGFNLVVYDYAYGFFIPLTDIVLDNPSTLSLFGYSEALIKLIKYAKKKGCKLICLDRDAEPTDELEKFEW
jgi:hypothetical protein